MSIIMDLFLRSQEKEKKNEFTDKDFWEIVDFIDHEYGGDTEAVTSSIIRHLKHCEDEYIFAFDDKLAELIYSLDGKEWADELFGNDPFNEDKFLCARCSAVAAGKEHYGRVIGGEEKLNSQGLHFHNGRWYGSADGLITAAAHAWSRKHLEDTESYPHKTKYSVSSHSNTEKWQ
ncbi:MAG: DUF4240 domain-containing protein [Ruminococcus sp.]|nr:DUF4240 domain-containing protein [Ruminococcus sp.]